MPLSSALFKKPSSPPPSNGQKRSHAMLSAFDTGDSDDSNDDEGQELAIESFGGDDIPQAPRVIAPEGDSRAWLAPQKKRVKTSHEGASSVATPQNNGKAAAVVDKGPEEETPHFGLQVFKRRTARSASPAARSDDADGDAQAAKTPQTDEQRALARLFGHESSPDLEDTTTTIQPEDAAYARSAAASSAQPTLDDYTATPVEGFGAALLRGYLPQGQSLESYRAAHAKRVKAAGGKRVDKDGNLKTDRRADLLGLGATELDLGDAPSVAGGRKGKRPMGEASYTALSRRNDKTGATFSEEEFKQRAEQAEREKMLPPPPREKKERERSEREWRDDRRGERRERGDSRRERERDDEYERERERRHRRHRHDKDDEYERRDRDRDRHSDWERHKSRDRHRDSGRHRSRSREGERSSRR